MNVPVVFFIYNRPDLTRRAFAAIRARRPATLVLVADGPRPGDDRDAELCSATRAVADRIDWPCELHTDFAPLNLGCAQRISSGVSTVLQRWEAAIFLEDDCVAGSSFFPFVEQLLDRYANEPRVCAITGSNFQFGLGMPSDSYYFSRFPIPWGWATWSRAWRAYDAEMRTWPSLRDANWLDQVFPGDRAAARHWTAAFDRAHRRAIDTWDYAWFLACWKASSLAAVPTRNLVTNIGFSGAATHTSRKRSALADIGAESLPFPLRHPREIQRNTSADRVVQRFVFQRQSLLWLRRATGAARKLLTGRGV